ncbi:hypothetical protein JCM15548_13027 [Geofilum rubicundum JCM 15548]|uniref:Uncharacterized protein n=1 Tax=Geofilum rubicundum JCM 15548 TaxID=1236989 RepID=A0A0E9M008_9BACT|nr:hypothetical protein JCM15548_13027 [Geofilum rubicundum JCM 15548]
MNVVSLTEYLPHYREEFMGSPAPGGARKTLKIQLLSLNINPTRQITSIFREL